MQDHQRYFPVRAKDGKLLPRFIAVANIESRDPPQVRAGNERVVRPRLADAAFFYAADRKTTLASRREALAGVTFQAQLGTLADKTARVTALAGADRAGRGPGSGRGPARRGTRQMRPSDRHGRGIPGIAGGHGPLLRPDMTANPRRSPTQSPSNICPVSPAIRCPATGAGLALAVADKLDTLVGIFAIGQKPTGAKDPYGLRRAALGVLRILIETGIASTCAS